MYIGETGRSLGVRVKEHQRYVRFANTNSAVFNHVQDHDHPINWDSSKIVYSSSNKQKRLLVESALIKHIPNINLMPGVCSVDLAAKDIILSTNPQILNNIPPPN
jgi:hypothetical protein